MVAAGTTRKKGERGGAITPTTANSGSRTLEQIPMRHITRVARAATHLKPSTNGRQQDGRARKPASAGKANRLETKTNSITTSSTVSAEYMMWTMQDTSETLQNMGISLMYLGTMPTRSGGRA